MPILKSSRKYFSYVDTALRTLYFNLESLYDDGYVSKLQHSIRTYENAPLMKSILLKEIIDFNFTKNEPLSYLFFHEWHHYLQSLAYPFAYYLSWIELKTILTAQDSIQKHQQDIDLQGGKFIRLNNEVYNNLTYQIYNYEFQLSNGWLNVNTENINPVADDNVFCITDLIENSTSVFHYKIIHRTESTASGYWKWLRNPRNKSYKNLFFFLSAEIGYEKTYELLPLLTLLSFYVTEPLHAFCTLFNQRTLFTEDLQANLSIGKDILSALYTEVNFRNNDYFFVQETPVGLISDDQFNYLLEKTKVFPLSMPAARFHKERATLEEAILTPEHSSAFEHLSSQYQPMAIHYNFTDFNTRETGFVYNMDVRQINGERSELYLAEIAKLKDVTLSLISPFNKSLPKTCHHKDCPYFDFGLCHRWNSIPIDYRKCSFPTWFAMNFSKEIIPEKRLLRHLHQKEIDDFAEKNKKLKELHQDKHKWQYIFDEEHSTYNLFILRETVEKIDVLYTISFLDMLVSQHGFEKIANSVSLTFDGFDDDVEIFSIEKVVEWFKLLKAQLPELFFYINLGSSNRNGYMVYFFIEHKTTWASSNQFEKDAAPEVWNSYIDGEAQIFINFCKRNHLDFEKHFLATYSSFIS
jgi:hypothetical protein